MSIRIDQKKCVGCRKCSEVCPGTLIVMEDKKAVMKYPKNCWGCVSCVKEAVGAAHCQQPSEAIHLKQKGVHCYVQYPEGRCHECKKRR